MTERLVDRWTAELLGRWTRGSRFRRRELPRFDLDGLARDAPFGTQDDRVDLRGLPLRSLRVEPSQLAALDLRHARFDNVRVDEPIWRDVLLDHASMTDCVIRNARLTDVQFVSTTIGGSLLGEGIAPQFEGCTFDRLRGGKADLGNSAFYRCSFSNLKHRIEPGAATYEECDFSGRIAEFELGQGWTSRYDARRWPKPPSKQRSVGDF